MKTKSNLILLSLLLVLASCSTPATLGYLRDMEYNTPYVAQEPPEPKLQEDDRLSITVFSTVDAVLAEPFNIGTGGTGVSTSVDQDFYYVVDREGNIDFPTLGKIYVKGLTTNEVRDKISELINSSGYMKDPVVKVDMGPFTITVLGETGQGIMTITEKKFNILQVIAQSGGTSAASKINDVMVIRTRDAERVAYAVDLQSRDLFNSPVFYVQQNDIIYIKPRGIRLSTTGQTIINVLQTVFGFFSSLGLGTMAIR